MAGCQADDLTAELIVIAAKNFFVGALKSENALRNRAVRHQNIHAGQRAAENLSRVYWIPDSGPVVDVERNLAALAPGGTDKFETGGATGVALEPAKMPSV